MSGYDGNKTLLPLKPGNSIYSGELPILLHILGQLPTGPKALVVHHCKEDVINATRHLDVSYCEQTRLDGTGGALLASRPFLMDLETDRVVITMGDVPFVAASTYQSLLGRLDEFPFVVLGFEPSDLKQYGILQTSGRTVKRIIEWKYWQDYSETKMASLGGVCNSGIYAADLKTLVECLDRLERHPHMVIKERNGQPVQIKEYFITDLVELLIEDEISTGYVVAPDENEVMGIDDPQALKKAQKLYSQKGGFV